MGRSHAQRDLITGRFGLKNHKEGMVMAIMLIGKYHAYAPPFKYISMKDPTDIRIGGIEEHTPWTDELGGELLRAWNDRQAGVIKTIQLPSAHTPGLFYTVRHYHDGWVCSCPARGNCWHIKVAKELEFQDSCSADKMDGKPRSEEEKYG
jgi:hypothetical protein